MLPISEEEIVGLSVCRLLIRRDIAMRLLFGLVGAMIVRLLLGGSSLGEEFGTLAGIIAFSRLLDESFPIKISLMGYTVGSIPIPRLSAFGAFDEGHTEFLRTLIIDYLKCQPYINFTTPLPEKPDFYTTPNFYGSTNLIRKFIRFTGNTVEGRVAGLLLAVLYWNDEDPRCHPVSCLLR